MRWLPAPQDSEELKEWLASSAEEVKAAAAAQEATSSRVAKAKAKAKAKEGKEDSDWPSLHRSMFREAKFRCPPVWEMNYTPDQLAKMSGLCDRSREVILWHDLKLGHIDPTGPALEHFIDIGQSLGRVPSCVGSIPCLTPGSLPWCRKRFRLLQPNECLAAQGFQLMPLAFFNRLGLSHRTVRSLAGNAFNAHTAMAFTFAALCTFPNDTSSERSRKQSDVKEYLCSEKALAVPGLLSSCPSQSA
eukprot:8402587-Pyramimonas_sp.AAC.2